LRGTLGSVSAEFSYSVIATLSANTRVNMQLLNHVCLISTGFCAALYNQQLYQAASMLFDSSEPWHIHANHFWAARWGAQRGAQW